MSRMGSTVWLARTSAAMSALALAVSLSGVSPAAAIHAVQRALFADDAGSVDGISASRTPRPGRLLPLDRHGRLPARVLPDGGPRGARGPMGPRGPQGAAGVTDVRLATGAGRELSRTADQQTELARIDNLPSGRWLLLWSATAVYLTGNVTTVACVVQSGAQQLAPAEGGVGGLAGATHALTLSSMAAVDQPTSFDVSLRCADNDAIAPGDPAVTARNQRLVAIRTDGLELTGG